MLSPNLVKGLKFIKNEANTFFSYKGLKVPTDNFEKGIFEAISQALGEISLNTLSFEKTENGFFAKADKLKLHFNNYGYLTRLEYNDIKIDFYDYK